MANFPIVNANLYIKQYNRRLMQPFKVLKKAGFEIMFTGIITEKVIDAIKQDDLIGSFITLQEASREVGKICNAYKNNDIDLTILLTHIGFESDIALAKMLHPDWGVDMIIGGHSHTILEKPEKVNNILIAQAGVGTDQIGRFDITVDDATNSIIEYKWKLVTINDRIAKPDLRLKKFITSFKSVVDKKYNTIVCKLARELTHPKREVETALGNLFADAFAQNSQSDVQLVGSGSIRSKSLGPVVTLQDLMSCFPYDDTLTRFSITGSQLRTIFEHFMRKDNRDGEGENYQVNHEIKAVYNDKTKTLESLKINDIEVENAQFYTLCIQGFHYKNCKKYLNISNEELISSGKTKVVSTSAQEVFEEFLRNNQNTFREVEGRLVYKSVV
jgi:5'-nucleotidase